MKAIKTPPPVRSGHGTDFSTLDLDDALDALISQGKAQVKQNKALGRSQVEEEPKVKAVFDDGWTCTKLVLIHHEIECLVCGAKYEAPGDVLVERHHARHGTHRHRAKDTRIYSPGGCEIASLHHEVEARKLSVVGCKRCFDLATLIEQVINGQGDSQ
jgi:hypothetical protein